MEPWPEQFSISNLDILIIHIQMCPVAKMHAWYYFVIDVLCWLESIVCFFKAQGQKGRAVRWVELPTFSCDFQHLETLFEVQVVLGLSDVSIGQGSLVKLEVGTDH